jgi:hypothetical protein
MRDRGANRENVSDMLRQKTGEYTHMRLERLKLEAKGSYPFSDKEAQYKGYTDLELFYAIQDAGRAARNFRGVPGEESTEGWYMDDVGTIGSEMRRRGMLIPGASM